MIQSAKTIKILYISCCENGFFALKFLEAFDYSISAVVTVLPSVAEKNNISGYVDLTNWCDKHAVQCIALDNYKLTISDVSHLDYDLVVVNGWNRLISAEIIDSAKLGGIGLHAGHPPIGLGRSPLVWNILLGFQDIEVYCFRLTTQADDGEIYCQKPVEITQFDTAQLLYEKVMLVGKDLIIEAIHNIAQEIAPVAQFLEHAHYYSKRTPEDGLINFSESAMAIYNFVRSQTYPYPGAFGYLDKQKWVIHQAIPFDRFAFRDVPRLPGRVIEALPSGIIVQTGTDTIWITEATINNEIALRNVDMDFKHALCNKIFSKEC